jgi:hypothetical protein
MIADVFAGRMGQMRLAQVNVARMRAAADSPIMAGFVAAVDPVFRMAENCPGFVWRLRDAGGHMPTCRDEQHVWQVVNVSVWVSYEALHHFVYRSHHGAMVRKRAEWFLPTPQPSTALWWITNDHLPELDESLARLKILRRDGPSPRVFSLRRRFEPDGSATLIWPPVTAPRPPPRGSVRWRR